MKTMIRCGGYAALAVALIGAAQAFAATNLPLNSPTTVNGIDAACTGIGEDAQQDARWTAYPLRIETTGKDGQWLADDDVSITRDGKDVVGVHCGGPWVLLKLPAGAYRVTGVLNGQSTEAKALVPASGQSRVILRFPKAGGAISPQHQPTQ